MFLFKNPDEGQPRKKSLSADEKKGICEMQIVCAFSSFFH